ncbi:hypothetical protein [Streptomyces sp. NPDC006551]|uniref:hypothetical protein n=1 Tax=Streptomyces sp. NPDC006551 TaxID=3157178 RepID=UPI0033B39766
MASTDFQLIPTQDTASVPLDTEPGEPVAVPTPTTPAPASAAVAAARVDHTAGGLPAIPLALIASNSTVAGLSAAAIVGGPVALAAAGAVVAAGGVAAAVRSRKTPKKTSPRGARAGGATNRAVRTGSPSSGSGSGAGRRGSSSGRAAGHRGAATASRSRASKARTSPLKTGPKPASKTNGLKSAGGAGRLGQIKQLRAARKTAAPSRKDAREQTTAARRALRDQKRAAKQASTAAAKTTGTTGGTSGGSGRAAATRKTRPGRAVADGRRQQERLGRISNAARRRAQRAFQQAVQNGRARQDQRTATRQSRIQAARRHARAAAHLMRQKVAARARFAVRAAGAAALAAPIGLLGFLTSPLGRKLGWSWMIHPGRRLYARLTRNARYDLRARLEDAQNTYAYDTDPENADTPALIAADVPRGPRRTATPTTLTGEPAVSENLKFLFDESASEMEAAAAAYEPGGMMHVYQTVQGMPAGIQSWANTFKILAEKSDDVFPLEPAVGEALSEVFEHLQKAAAAAEEVRVVFQREHEHDIERLEAPRKNLEAEKAWDASSNEDYL